MKIERTIAAAVLALGLSALLYAQAPGLFSDIYVDGSARLYDTLQVDGALTLTLEDQIAKRDIADSAVGQGQLDTATGTSTGTGERSVSVASAYSFWPTLTGDPLCVVVGSPGGWDIRTSIADRWGELPGHGTLGSSRGIAAIGSSLWAVRTTGDISVFSQSDPSILITTHDRPFGLTSGHGITGSSALNLFVVGVLPEVWFLNCSGAICTGTSKSLPTLISPRGIAGLSESSLWVADATAPDSIWSIDCQGSTCTGTEKSLPPGFGAIDGISGTSEDRLWVADSGNDSIWLMDCTAPACTGTEYIIPQLGFPTGISALGSDLWISDLTSPASIWRQPQANPSATDCGVSNTLTWRYVTASDNPQVSVRRTAGGEVVELWQSEDPPGMMPPISIRPWETTTDTVVSPGPPATATLATLYAAADTDDRTAAVQALSAYVAGRGWLSGVSAVGDIANVPERGCGAPGGDCEPAARLHALRSLAEAVHPDAPDAVFELVSGSLRVDAAGVWSVAP